MKKQEFINMLWSFGRVFFAAALAQYISIGKDIFSLDTETWKAIIGAGVSALVITAYNYFNGHDPRYGYGKQKQEEADEPHVDK